MKQKRTLTPLDPTQYIGFFINGVIETVNINDFETLYGSIKLMYKRKRTLINFKFTWTDRDYLGSPDTMYAIIKYKLDRQKSFRVWSTSSVGKQDIAFPNHTFGKLLNHNLI